MFWSAFVCLVLVYTYSKTYERMQVHPNQRKECLIFFFFWGGGGGGGVGGRSASFSNKKINPKSATVA